MRWLVCFALLAGCLRARATVVHPTEVERVNGGAGSTVIARKAPAATREVPRPEDASTSIASLELGALVAFTGPPDAARVHIAPGVRIFGVENRSVLWGVAVGADFVGRRRHKPSFALEGSVHAGGGDSNDPTTIQVAVDVFAGVTVHSSHSTIAVGPSVGLLGLPGGHSAVMFGLGLRLTGGRRH